MDKRIIVNATALVRSGTLSILRQFVENIPSDSRKWLIFVSPQISLDTENKNVRIEPIEGVRAMHRRLWWDAIGVRKWLKVNDIEPVAVISLQNNGFNVGKNVPSFIYYHQPLPFFRIYWNPLKVRERRLWLYKNVYPFIIKYFLKKDSVVFVQLDIIKKDFSKRFKYPERLIKVYCPSVSIPKESIVPQACASSHLKLLYPAMPHSYKNHSIIDEALKLSDADVEILFTIDPEKRLTTDERIRFMGLQPYERICALYHECDALLFPSYIETFGLPLLEAAMAGMPIIASDLPYAREVLEGYEGVKFVKFNDPQAWKNAIESIEKGKRYRPIDISKRPGWKDLFDNIKWE